MDDKQQRPATHAENLRTLRARLSEYLSPAEVSELEAAAEEIEHLEWAYLLVEQVNLQMQAERDKAVNADRHSIEGEQVDPLPVAWLICDADDNPREVVLTPLTDDTFIDEGESVWPLYRDPVIEREVGSLSSHVAPTPKAEHLLSEHGVFAGHSGLRGMAEHQEFWDEQPYGTRFYWGHGGGQYLHRSVLRAAVAALDKAASALSATASNVPADGGSVK